MSQLGFASIPSVLQYLRYAESQNLDTNAAIKHAGIDAALLDNQNGRIRGEQFQSLIESLIDQSDDPVFGLNTSQQVQPDSYSVLGFIAMSCSTIGEAIDHIPTFERLVGDMGITTIDKIHHNVILSWHCAYTISKVRQHMIDNVLASWTQYARSLANIEANPDKVLLEREAPSKRVAKAYEAFFKAPVVFGQKRNAIVLPAAFLSLSLRQADLSRLKTLESHAQEQIAELKDPQQRFSVRVSNAIRKQLEMGTARKELIATEFNMTERTLQRKLNAEGHSYQSLLDHVRKELAIEMLKYSDFALQDIAYNLGFSDARSFYRRFKIWMGVTPGGYRKQLE